MPLIFSEDAPLGDPLIAAALAAACQFAYYPTDRGAEAFQSEFGLAATLVSVNNTQAYVATNSETILVAFRGSEGPASIEGLKDWLLTNALNLLIQPEGKLAAEFLAAGVGARWHQGFIAAITDIWDALGPTIDAAFHEKDRPVWVTGHSLGGALALLGAWLLKRKMIPIHRVVTFGAPMVGNKPVADAIDREFPGRIARYVNAPDPVPLLPMMSLIANDYAHCAGGVTLGDTAAPDSAIAFAAQMARSAGGAALSGNLSEELWGPLKSRILAHLLDDYRKHLG